MHDAKTWPPACGVKAENRIFRRKKTYDHAGGKRMATQTTWRPKFVRHFDPVLKAPKELGGNPGRGSTGELPSWRPAMA
jgi:hypothetical protein